MKSINMVLRVAPAVLTICLATVVSLAVFVLDGAFAQEINRCVKFAKESDICCQNPRYCIEEGSDAEKYFKEASAAVDSGADDSIHGNARKGADAQLNASKLNAALAYRCGKSLADCKDTCAKAIEKAVREQDRRLPDLLKAAQKCQSEENWNAYLSMKQQGRETGASSAQSSSIGSSSGAAR